MTVACIEIGSGMTSIYVPKTGTFTLPALFKTKTITLSRDLKEGNFKEICKTLNEFKAFAQKLNVNKIVVIGTQDLKDAANVKEICEETGLEIEIVSAERESYFALISAATIHKISKSELTSFDMGNGSMQLCTMEKEDLKPYSERLGAQAAVDIFWNDVRKQSPSKINPVSQDELKTLIDLLCELVHSKLPKDLSVYLKKNLIGTGFVALVARGLKATSFGVKEDNTLKFTLNDLGRLLGKLTDSDASVRSAYFDLLEEAGIWSDRAVPAIAMLFAIMKELNCEEVTCCTDEALLGNAPGVLVDFYQRSIKGK